MIDRRSLLKSGVLTAATGVSAVTVAREAPAMRADRGMIGDYHRLPSLDAEGRLDFLWGVEAYAAGVQAPAADKAAVALLDTRGIDPSAPVTTATAVALLGPDPLIALHNKTYLEAQRAKMRVVRAAFAPDEAAHVADLDRAMSIGPGSLTLDPDLVIPAYARHSLHMQPGGYVGDPLAGHVFRHAIVGLSSGHNFQNETHDSIAAIVPVPTDGRVLRVLELGCGIGQLASALQARFPDAEVWGIDTSAPMLRYAHLRASELGQPLRFAQQSAEALTFPAGHFDVVTASGLFHEIAPDATRHIVREVARVLRPGGTFYPLDLNTAGPPGTDARSRFAVWLSYRWYHEDWREDYAAIDLDAEMRDAGLTVNPNGPALARTPGARPNVMATRSA